MKLIGLVFLGLIASAVFYFPVFILVAIFFSIIDKVGGFLLGDFAANLGEGGLLLAIFVVAPITFLLGSMITGYFSYYEIEDKRSLPLDGAGSLRESVMDGRSRRSACIGCFHRR